jgi:hypothetical protein
VRGREQVRHLTAAAGQPASMRALGHSMQQHQSCTHVAMWLCTEAWHGTIREEMQVLRVRCACKHLLMLPGHACISQHSQSEASRKRS